MRPYLLLFLCCCCQAQPPAPPGFTKPLLSPKDSGSRVATVSAPFSNSPNAAVTLSTTGFAMTDISVAGDQVTIGWQGGVQPVQLEQWNGSWAETGLATIRNSHMLSYRNSSPWLFRVRQAVQLVNQPTNGLLTWNLPEINMSDSFVSLKIERSASGVEATATNNGTLNDPITTLLTSTQKTITTAGFVVPAKGVSVNVTVAAVDAAYIAMGKYVTLPGYGLFKVNSVTGLTLNLLYDANTDSNKHAGENAPSGTQVLPGFLQDNTTPAPTLFYRVTGTTANGDTVVGNVVKAFIGAAGDSNWGRFITNRQRAQIYCVTIGADGKIYVAGTFLGGADDAHGRTLTFPGGRTVANTTGWAIFVACFTSDGTNTDWAIALDSNTPFDTYPASIAVDSTLGKVYIGGYFIGTLASVGTSNYAGFVLALNTADGSKAWARILEGTASGVNKVTSVIAPQIGSNATVFVAALIKTSITVAGRTLYGAYAGTAPIVVRLNPADGVPLWGRTLGIDADAKITNLAYDALHQNIVLQGQAGGDVDPTDIDGSHGAIMPPFSGNVIQRNPNSNGTEVFITRISPADGAWISGSNLPMLYADTFMLPTGLAVDGSGAIFVFGLAKSTANFGLGPFTVGGPGFYLAKFSLANACLFCKGLTTYGPSNVSNNMALDSAGNPIVVGAVDQGINFGNGRVDGVPFQGTGWIAKFIGTATGINPSNLAWYSMCRGTGGNSLNQLAIGQGSLIVVGFESGDITVRPTTYSGDGYADAFLTQLNP